MSLILKTNVVFDNPNAPYLKLFDDIEDRKGSVYLWDASLAPVSSTNVGTVFPNILEGYGDAGPNTNMTMEKGSNQNGTFVRSELTAKGAVHFIASQNIPAEVTVNQKYLALISSTNLQAKLFNMMMGGAPRFYFSVWLTATRRVEKTPHLGPLVYYGNSNTTNLGFYIASTHNNVGKIGSGKNMSKLNKSFSSQDVVGVPNFYNAEINTVGGAGVLNTTPLYIGTGGVSPFSGSVSSNQAWNGCPSFAVYRIYIEDLSKSGRTYEEVRDIDIAEHTKAFGVGGRFYNDTWSNPASVLP